MRDKKRVAEVNAGMFMADRGVAVVPIRGLNVGPGDLGPGDEWHMPPEPVSEDDRTTQPPTAVESSGRFRPNDKS